MINKEEIVTGDNIELICDYIFDIDNYIDRVKYQGDKQKLIDEQINIINIQKPSIIFVYGHDTIKFLQNINKIQYKFTLVTHNSDLGIFEEYRPYINDNIIKWFGQNNYIKHEKVFSLPIGIARARWLHGNLDLLKNVMNQNNTKTNLVYKNFNINTNINERLNVHRITQQNGIVLQEPKSIQRYWEELSKACFIISPKGNGVDCHRIWESLYLKSVPVVQKHPTFDQFNDLPILFIDDWSQVTFEFLKKNLNIFDKFNDSNSLEKLKISYWKKIITKN